MYAQNVKGIHQQRTRGVGRVILIQLQLGLEPGQGEDSHEERGKERDNSDLCIESGLSMQDRPWMTRSWVGKKGEDVLGRRISLCEGIKFWSTLENGQKLNVAGPCGGWSSGRT